MELFDDFEMKPITEGLGFHKKEVNLKESLAQSELLKGSLKSEPPMAPPKEFFTSPEDEESVDNSELDDLMAALDKMTDTLNSDLNKVGFKEDDRSRTPAQPTFKVTQALPREEERKVMSEVLPTVETPEPFSPSITEEIIENKQEKRPLVRPVKQDTGVRRGAADSPLRLLEPASVSIASSLLDAVVVLAFSLLFLVSLLLVTHVDLISVFVGLQTDTMTQASIGLLYVAVLQMYVVVSRSFFGKTLGEWTFDYQMGDNGQIKSSLYPVLVLWRSFVTILTGLVLLPLLSLIFRVDIASYLSGLQLYRRK